ncbi:recombinase family protein [Cohnella faecalis]|uniref:Recombinase family protein n=1 Tax=Cohnella faecalis TaxID=2315694 RepID=A0A398CPY0_9BACL|nr:recombinase family protein [Cohnella faecalis]
MIPAKSSCTAIYIRVSLEEQAKYGFSIDGQLNELKQYCKLNKLGIHDTYIDRGLPAAKQPDVPS